MKKSGKVIGPNIPPEVLADMWQFMLKTSVPRILADHEKKRKEEDEAAER